MPEFRVVESRICGLCRRFGAGVERFVCFGVARGGGRFVGFGVRPDATGLNGGFAVLGCDGFGRQVTKAQCTCRCRIIIIAFINHNR